MLETVFKQPSPAFSQEAVMPEAKILGKGNKRRIAQIKWKRWEIAHAIVLFLLLAILSVWLAVWFEMQHLD
ncbi:MAG: hypothetical protein WA826_19170 [Silvibacterium sp.]